MNLYYNNFNMENAYDRQLGGLGQRVKVKPNMHKAN